MKVVQSAFTHTRHYITDNEYIPYNENIKEYVHREIDKPIIDIQIAPPVGYEILPNKYFFRYVKPSESEKVIQQFWKLEEEAEAILNQLEKSNVEV